MRYYINLDLKVKIWKNVQAEVEFDGTEEDFRAYLEEHDGCIDDLHADYNEHEYVVETEEPLSKVENKGEQPYELKEIEES